eukprot:evm.model.scf_483.4 EVM.evm.TU.scf_483.4   scf_483:74727-77043(-)
MLHSLCIHPPRPSHTRTMRSLDSWLRDVQTTLVHVVLMANPDEFFPENVASQILRQNHALLLDLLGKTSGRDVDKLQELPAKGFQLKERFGMATLLDCAGAMELTIMSDAIPCGDHDVVLCEVTQYDQGEGQGAILYTEHLREKGLL